MHNLDGFFVAKLVKLKDGEKKDDQHDQEKLKKNRKIKKIKNSNNLK